MTTPWADKEQVKEEIARLARVEPAGAVIFDADGTLWSHDVGCMVFEQAIAEDAFREPVRPGLLAEARAVGLNLAPDAELSSVAQALLSALEAGRYGERRAAEMQVWAYAGSTETEFRSLTRRALESRGHRTGLHDHVLEIADWARQQKLFVGIVSASPTWVVEEATRTLGFAPERVEAGEPEMNQNVIAPKMARPLPYGPDKVVAGKRLLGARAWLATFGDSGFDVDMMNAARLAVGIGDRGAMLTGLELHPKGLRLKSA